MTHEEIKKIIDDERVEQLTAQMCHHWEVASRRLVELLQELDAQTAACIDAELYAVLMRLQQTAIALMELNKNPYACLFTDYLESIRQTISDSTILQSVIAMLSFLTQDQEEKPQEDFFSMIVELLAHHQALAPEKQEAIHELASPLEQLLPHFAQHMNGQDLLMVIQTIQQINEETKTMDQQTANGYLQNMRQQMNELSAKMTDSRHTLLISLLLFMLLPGLQLKIIAKGRSNARTMALLFNKVLVRIRESEQWQHYWRDHRETLKVVSDSASWQDIMASERTKEREELAKVPEGLFAKWTTDPKAFETAFLAARLSDDDLRYFLFHLTSLYEITRELDPLTTFGEEQLVLNEKQQVANAVMEAAGKLYDEVVNAWLPYYEDMWRELIAVEEMFQHLRVTRKSPHNNLFTARFFCHLVGEMKKSAIFGVHSDGDLAEKLTTKRYLGTFRKNIQEGMGEETSELQSIFNAILQKYKDLANAR